MQITLRYNVFGLDDEDAQELEMEISDRQYDQLERYDEECELLDEDFSNETYSTCTLYGYVKYVGSNEIIYGEPQDYELDYKEEPICPDSNHPHMIDLGLSVKWACCNVGAHAPEEYGSYFAWGETQPKAVYNEANYLYYNGPEDKNGDGRIDRNSIIDEVGLDIAGTGYDAATANWGTLWRMPSSTEISELKNCTKSEFTTVNGIAGLKFEGPNGNTIFLPFAGYRNGSSFGDAGYGGSYLSSPFDSFSENRAWSFGISRSFGISQSSNLELNTTPCNYGLSVRPVR